MKNNNYLKPPKSIGQNRIRAKSDSVDGARLHICGATEVGGRTKINGFQEVAIGGPARNRIDIILYFENSVSSSTYRK